MLFELKKNDLNVRGIPNQPGCYLFYNQKQEILYIGKAKNLYKRVSNYFRNSHNLRLTKMLSEATYINIIVTKSEVESLLLECNLIKKHKPKYNILLQDDKRYPYIHITNEPFPRIVIQRQLNRKKKYYFGPIPDGHKAREILQILNRLFPFRKCRFIPKTDCLYYDIGQCWAPCINKNISEEDYIPIIKEVETFFAGNVEKIIKTLDRDIQQAAEFMQFEKAQDILNLKKSVVQVTSTQNIQFPSKTNIDVLGSYIKNNYLVITIFFYRLGSFIMKDDFILPIIWSPEETFDQWMAQFYLKNIPPKLILVDQKFKNNSLNDALNLNLITPQQGTKKEILEMANENARISFEKNVLYSLEKIDKRKEIINDLKLIFNTKQVFEKIILVDTSHISGEHYIGAVICFEQGKKSFKLYRKFSLKEINEPNDPLAIQLTLTKYLSTVIMDPDLIIVDGGISQVNFAKKALNSLKLTIPLLGLVKDDNHKTDSIINENGNKIEIPHTSYLFLELTKMQDEVHNFAIRSFRQQQSNDFFTKKKLPISGVGDKTYLKLIKEFGNIEQIKNASVPELMRIVSKKQAEDIYNYFKMKSVR